MWATLLPIIAKYGLDFAYSLWTKIQTGKDPTATDWTELKAFANKDSEAYLKEACARAGIAWDSPQALELRKALCPGCFIPAL
jgi:hypothetical protein